MQPGQRVEFRNTGKNAVVAVFIVLALRGSISADNVMLTVSMVISFYFGTQHEKKE